jgi:predicted RNA binding protein YcfA (HicA-like mRNA interferase family)
VVLPKQTSRQELIRKFHGLGWAGPRSGSKHEFMIKGTKKQHIPNPHESDIGLPLLKRILQQAGISVDEWNLI